MASDGSASPADSSAPDQESQSQSTVALDSFVEHFPKQTKNSLKLKLKIPKPPPVQESDNDDDDDDDESDAEAPQPRHSPPKAESVKKPLKRSKKISEAEDQLPPKKPKKASKAKVARKQPKKLKQIPAADDDDEADKEGEECGQQISIPKGHRFLGEFRGVSVKQLFGSVVIALHRYEMLKTESGLPIVKNGKLLTSCKKYEYTMKQRELEALYRIIPSVIKEMEKESAILERVKEASFGSTSY